MKEQFIKFVNDSKQYLGKHSPEILTGIGLIGMVSATVTAIKVTPKALILIEDKKKELKKSKLKPIETIKTVWKPYLPVAGLTIISGACIIGASTVNYKRNAALGTAYAISEKTLLHYRDKVVETLGENKEREIHDKIAQDTTTNTPIGNGVIVTSKGNTLCLDMLSGRYFMSDIDTIKKAINQINRRLNYDDYISLNELYYELGLDGIKNGDLLGWNLSDGLIDPTFSTCLAENDQPCITIDYMVGPKYGYDKLI